MTSRLRRLRALLPQESSVLLLVLGIVLSLWVFLVIAGLMTAGRTQGIDERILLATRQPADRAIPVGPAWCQAAALQITELRFEVRIGESELARQKLTRLAERMLFAIGCNPHHW